MENEIKKLLKKSGVGEAIMNQECAKAIRLIRTTTSAHDISREIRLLYIGAFLAGRRKELRDINTI